MSRTTKHTIKGKFNNGAISKEELPLNVLKGFSRYNFEVGRFRAERVEKLSRIRQEAEISDLEETNLYKTICE